MEAEVILGIIGIIIAILTHEVMIRKYKKIYKRIEPVLRNLNKVIQKFKINKISNKRYEKLKFIFDDH